MELPEDLDKYTSMVETVVRDCAKVCRNAARDAQVIGDFKSYEQHVKDEKRILFRYGLVAEPNAAAPQALRNTTGQAETPPTTPVDAAVPTVNEHLLSDLKEHYEHDREAARLEGMKEAARICDKAFDGQNPAAVIRAEIAKRNEKS